MRKIIVSAVVLLLTTSSAWAALPKSSGAYLDIGAGVGGNSHSFKFKFNKFDQWFGASVGLGYKLNMFFAVEADAYRFPNQVWDNKSSSANWAWGLTGKLIMPFDNGVNLFAKGGWINLYQTLNQNATSSHSHQRAWVYGAGMSLFVDQSLGFTLQGEMTTQKADIPRQALITFGTVYIF